MDTQVMADNALAAERLLKLLANRNRLMILCRLMNSECSVTQLNEQIPLAQSALSQHLAALRQAGVVTTRRDAQTIYYTISDDKAVKIIERIYELFCQGAD
ncbi:ArsR/SmtB family transcription factor [Thalassotalea mangrovi]|uniref:Winged helix-turn-helix transcriptional regulator n=1 Tax=Thalassotalea mangrovi TaxID=2572245 RepID=A0A4U1B205_9GAMM|nr:metalloregulator ArsR/SmtB family transcription factor [Thalassotalea mangrovi]TKB43462.1 winged helix-turn-helix transcriptional regulator [Thalassotalea mangrovi]